MPEKLSKEEIDEILGLMSSGSSGKKPEHADNLSEEEEEEIRQQATEHFRYGGEEDDKRKVNEAYDSKWFADLIKEKGPEEAKELFDSKTIRELEEIVGVTEADIRAQQERVLTAIKIADLNDDDKEKIMNTLQGAEKELRKLTEEEISHFVDIVIQQKKAETQEVETQETISIKDTTTEEEAKEEPQSEVVGEQEGEKQEEEKQEEEKKELEPAVIENPDMPHSVRDSAREDLEEHQEQKNDSQITSAAETVVESAENPTIPAAENAPRVLTLEEVQFQLQEFKSAEEQYEDVLKRRESYLKNNPGSVEIPSELKQELNNAEKKVGELRASVDLIPLRDQKRAMFEALTFDEAEKTLENIRANYVSAEKERQNIEKARKKTLRLGVGPSIPDEIAYTHADKKASEAYQDYKDILNICAKKQYNSEKNKLIQEKINKGETIDDALIEGQMKDYIKTVITKKYVIDENIKLTEGNVETYPPKKKNFFTKMVTAYGKMPKWQRYLISTTIATGTATTGILAAGGGFLGVGAYAGYRGTKAVIMNMAGTQIFQGLTRLGIKGWDTFIGKKKTEEFRTAALHEEICNKGIDFIGDAFEKQSQILEETAKRRGIQSLIQFVGVTGLTLTTSMLYGKDIDENVLSVLGDKFGLDFGDTLTGHGQQEQAGSTVDSAKVGSSKPEVSLDQGEKIETHVENPDGEQYEESHVAEDDGRGTGENIEKNVEDPSVVKQGEGLWNAIARQVKERILANPQKYGLTDETVQNVVALKKVITTTTANILHDNNLIHNDGSQVGVYEGTKVILGDDDSVTIEGKTYEFNQVKPQVGEPQVEGGEKVDVEHEKYVEKLQNQTHKSFSDHRELLHATAEEIHASLRSFENAVQELKNIELDDCTAEELREKLLAIGKELHNLSEKGVEFTNNEAFKEMVRILGNEDNFEDIKETLDEYFPSSKALLGFFSQGTGTSVDFSTPLENMETVNSGGLIHDLNEASNNVEEINTTFADFWNDHHTDIEQVGVLGKTTAGVQEVMNEVMSRDDVIKYVEIANRAMRACMNTLGHGTDQIAEQFQDASLLEQEQMFKQMGEVLSKARKIFNVYNISLDEGNPNSQFGQLNKLMESAKDLIEEGNKQVDSAIQSDIVDEAVKNLPEKGITFDFIKKIFKTTTLEEMHTRMNEERYFDPRFITILNETIFDKEPSSDEMKMTVLEFLKGRFNKE